MFLNLEYVYMSSVGAEHLLWWLIATPSATRRSLDEAEISIKINKGIENTRIKSYNNYLSLLLVGNQTHIQVIQSTPDFRLVMRFYR